MEETYSYSDVILHMWVIIKKMEVFQITNKKIFDVSDFLFSEYEIIV